MRRPLASLVAGVTLFAGPASVFAETRIPIQACTSAVSEQTNRTFIPPQLSIISSSSKNTFEIPAEGLLPSLSLISSCGSVLTPGYMEDGACLFVLDVNACPGASMSIQSSYAMNWDESNTVLASDVHVYPILGNSGSSSSAGVMSGSSPATSNQSNNDIQATTNTANKLEAEREHAFPLVTALHAYPNTTTFQVTFQIADILPNQPLSPNVSAKSNARLYHVHVNYVTVFADAAGVYRVDVEGGGCASSSMNSSAAPPIEFAIYSCDAGSDGMPGSPTCTDGYMGTLSVCAAGKTGASVGVQGALALGQTVTVPVGGALKFKFPQALGNEADVSQVVIEGAGKRVVVRNSCARIDSAVLTLDLSDSLPVDSNCEVTDAALAALEPGVYSITITFVGNLNVSMKRRGHAVGTMNGGSTVTYTASGSFEVQKPRLASSNASSNESSNEVSVAVKSVFALSGVVIVMAATAAGIVLWRWRQEKQPSLSLPKDEAIPSVEEMELMVSCPSMSSAPAMLTPNGYVLLSSTPEDFLVASVPSSHSLDLSTPVLFQKQK
ncbi:hypothetical protein HDU77_009646 [Chytriomyces hyalinus]|nr:hypothetical protein HDU77_009646 [Chytriomyces hyalinus]